jgi:phosphoribosylaminoimidazole-succinocarboxamide synthase
VRRGTVRDVYDFGDKLVIVATDRISAFDVILPTPIPQKGVLLTAMSNYWFNFFNGRVGHHLLSTDVTAALPELRPYREQLQGRSALVRKTQVIPIECVVRGYLAGSGWAQYRKTKSICGVVLPPGLRQCDTLPAPIFTPTTKAQQGHDEPLHFDAACNQVGRSVMEFVRDRSIELYVAAAEAARKRGIIIADTKFEWGLPEPGAEPILIDEVLTPDSSRFWPADEYTPGQDQPSFDKQYVRNYLSGLNWDKTPPGPELPPDVVQRTHDRYLEAFTRLTSHRS